MYSTENPKRKTSSLSKMKERKDSTKTVEEKTKGQDKGKKKNKKLFLVLFKVIERTQWVMSWVLQQCGHVWLMQAIYLLL